MVALDPILNETVTPPLQMRIKNSGKYDTSPYVQLPEADLINKFVDWVYQNVSQRRNRKSAYTAVYDKLKPELDLGIVEVKKMDWFHIMVHDGRPWEDEDLISLVGLQDSSSVDTPLELNVKYRREEDDLLPIQLYFDN
ncbi:hypothetical protein KY285_007699 [Solanum tuberosum]|nr:hypothetical protein KY285_007699 [Solanum tuberosum]